MLKFTLVFIALACFLTAEARHKYAAPSSLISRDFFEKYLKRGCVAACATGCGNNNGKCCRRGDPYTGEMQTCQNVGSFSNPVFKCIPKGGC